MGMLNNPKKDNKIGRGAKVEVTGKVSINDLNSSETVKPEVTLPVNIRVDNHDRNAINAFIALGRFDSAKDFVKKMIDLYKDKLSDEDKKRFEYAKEMYEKKDFEREMRKRKK